MVAYEDGEYVGVQPGPLPVRAPPFAVHFFFNEVDPEVRLRNGDRIPVADSVEVLRGIDASDQAVVVLKANLAPVNEPARTVFAVYEAALVKEDVGAQQGGVHHVDRDLVLSQ